MWGERADVIVYGGSPAGIAAAVAAARRGASVTLLEQTRHVGGLSSSGLVTAESEHMLDESFSGIALEFYRLIGAAYGSSEPMFYWESRVAEEAFQEMLERAGVTVRYGRWVDRLQLHDQCIRSALMTDGSTVSGRVFVDATYEGDLMAHAVVPYRVGRESRAQYGETLAGVRFIERPDDAAPFAGTQAADMPIEVSPYMSPREDDHRLLPGLVSADGIVAGAADDKTMAYNFRITVSDAPDRVPITAPADYDPARYELLARYLRTRPATTLRDLIAFSPFASGRYEVAPNGRTRALPGRKWELNNRQDAVISLGYLGGQFQYPQANPEQRARIWEDHRNHHQGLLYFLAHDRAVPRSLRQEAAIWGLAPDEFTDNDHWPHYLYVREARRMVGAHVLTQHDIQSDRRKPDSVALGSHWIDGHHVQRLARSRTQFRNEGRIWVQVTRVFQIPYRCLTPCANDCGNLLVPVCVSASHVAFCSIRLEPTWMALGQAAGAAAALAAEQDVAVQRISVAALQEQLLAAGVRL
jgi:hypothetical protein